MGRTLLMPYDDYSNCGYHMTAALNSVGHYTLGAKWVKHYFGYPNELPLLKTKASINGLYRGSDIIVYFHNRWIFGSGARDTRVFRLKDKYGKLFSFFVGSREYRADPDGYNSFYNGFINFSLCHTPELMPLGLKNPHWYIPPLNTDELRPVYLIDDGPLKIAHFPNGPQNKNTKSINKVIKSLRKEGLPFIYMHRSSSYTKGLHRTWVDYIKQISLCDVYVESQAYTLDNKKLGMWGVTALEAAALGKIVVTCFNFQEEYKALHGVPCEMVASNSEVELYDTLKGLIKMHKGLLRRKAEDTRLWVEKVHSYQPSGIRLVEIFKKCRLDI
jgi:hypothetical protein